MATFWRRIREMFYGTLPDDDDLEVGVVMGEVEGTFRNEGDPVHVDASEEAVAVVYTGPLSQSDRPIYLHFGYGPGAWRGVAEARMAQVGDGVYEAELRPEPNAGVLEFCFRNDVGEWDNNNGSNWSHPL